MVNLTPWGTLNLSFINKKLPYFLVNALSKVIKILRAVFVLHDFDRKMNILVKVVSVIVNIIFWDLTI